MRVGLACVALLLASPAFADNFAALPIHPGRDITIKVCSQCHSPELVTTQRMDQAGWKALVDQMASNGAQATDAEFESITNYLATSFSVGGKTEPLPPPRADATKGVKAALASPAIREPTAGHKSLHTISTQRHRASKAPSRRPDIK